MHSGIDPLQLERESESKLAERMAELEKVHTHAVCACVRVHVGVGVGVRAYVRVCVCVCVCVCVWIYDCSINFLSLLINEKQTNECKTD
jgi:hypothetical protein